jgi:hypothetical protein
MTNIIFACIGIGFALIAFVDIVMTALYERDRKKYLEEHKKD